MAGMAILLSSAIGFCDTPNLQSEEGFNQWFSYYYLKPDPQRVPEAIRYFAGSLSEKYPNSRMPVAAFLAALFKADDALTGKVFSDISADGSENSKVLMVNALWLADTVKSRELLGKAKTQWNTPLLSGIIDRKNKSRADNLMEAPIQSPLILDMLWATFFATGSPEPIERIISVLHLMKEGHEMELLVGGAADWSLASNAQQHQRVYELCKAKLESSEGVTKELLQEIVQNAGAKN
ncbi:MAG: hypothetical protein Q7J69_05960 [Candidatus Omnitrophota bacterium]|nr:hypothetical protein [Candidatus Omnitrophota bacterium]